MNYKEFWDYQLRHNPKFREEYSKRDLRFDISHLITQARLSKNLSQEKLAKLLKTQQTSISRLESGKTLPSLSFLEKIAKALGTYLIAPKFGFMEETITGNVDIPLVSPYFKLAHNNMKTDTTTKKTVGTSKQNI